MQWSSGRVFKRSEETMPEYAEVHSIKPGVEGGCVWEDVRWDIARD